MVNGIEDIVLTARAGIYVSACYALGLLQQIRDGLRDYLARKMEHPSFLDSNERYDRGRVRSDLES